MMRRFVEEADRGQWTLLPECLDDFIDESNPVRVIDVFVDALDLAEMSSCGQALPHVTARDGRIHQGDEPMSFSTLSEK
jgi:transposase